MMGSSTRYTSCGRSSRGYSKQRSLTMSKTDERGSVQYRTEDHMAILFQMYGSVWKRVLPYCVVNTMSILLIGYMHSYHSIDLTFSDQGHMFMATMVSVLIVARSRITYQRYMESRRLISDITKASRELLQHTVTFSRYEIHPKGRQWRLEIAERVISCLRCLVAVLQSNGTKVSSYGGILGIGKEGRCDDDHECSDHQHHPSHEWQIVDCSKNRLQNPVDFRKEENNERSPMVWIIYLRSAIASHVKYLKTPLDVNEELKLCDCTAQIVTAYHGLMKLISTPFPFPLVQMTRTFLFVWVFSLPFALMSDDERAFGFITIFFISYGFIGLEFVSIELDDPFGDDPNDLDVLELAKVVFEDIFICIHDIDGEAPARQLREWSDKLLTETEDPETNTRDTIRIGASDNSKDASTESVQFTPSDHAPCPPTIGISNDLNFHDNNDENRQTILGIPGTKNTMHSGPNFPSKDQHQPPRQYRRGSAGGENMAKPPLRSYSPLRQQSYGSANSTSAGYDTIGAPGRERSSSLASLQDKIDAERIPLLARENSERSVTSGRQGLPLPHQSGGGMPKPPPQQHAPQPNPPQYFQFDCRQHRSNSIVTTGSGTDGSVSMSEDNMFLEDWNENEQSPDNMSHKRMSFQSDIDFASSNSLSMAHSQEDQQQLHYNSHHAPLHSHEERYHDDNQSYHQQPMHQHPNSQLPPFSDGYADSEYYNSFYFSNYDDSGQQQIHQPHHHMQQAYQESYHGQYAGGDGFGSDAGYKVVGRTTADSTPISLALSDEEDENDDLHGLFVGGVDEGQNDIPLAGTALSSQSNAEALTRHQ